MNRFTVVFLLLVFSFFSNAQDLMDMLGDSAVKDFTTATFKTTRIVNGKSIEKPRKRQPCF